MIKDACALAKPPSKCERAEKQETFQRMKFNKRQGASRNHQSQFDLKIKQANLAP